jgi:hypothetical protein
MMNGTGIHRGVISPTIIALFSVALILSAGTNADAHGIPVANGHPRVVSGAAGSLVRYHIDVPRNTRRLVIRLSGGLGNANMGAKHVSRPWVPAHNTATNAANIVVNNPPHGHWDIFLHGATGYLNATLLVRWEVRNNNWGAMAGHAMHAAPGILHGIAAIRSAGDRNDRTEHHYYHHRDDDDDEDDEDDDDEDDDDNDRDRYHDSRREDVPVLDTAPVASRLTITSPASGASLVAGRTYPVRWQAPADMRYAAIEVSWNTGRTWNRIATVPARTPGFVWHVATDQTASGLVIIRIVDADNPGITSARALAFSRR